MKDQSRIKLFSKVEVSFSKNGDELDTMQDYEQKEISSPSSSINRNVTVWPCREVFNVQLYLQLRQVQWLDGTTPGYF